MIAHFGTFKDMSVSLAQIESEWFHYKPAGQRPLGGRRALAGFNYQLSLSLATFFERVLHEDSQAAEAFEGLSDISQLTEGLLYVTQVKLTLSTTRLKEAYREFIIVDRFLEERFPDIRQITRYRVICRAASDSIRQKMTARELRLSRSDSIRWSAVSPRILPFEIRTDPFLDLVISIWREVSRPYTFVGSLRGLLLHHLAEGSTSAAIAHDLLKQLQAERVSTPPPGRVLSPRDFADRSAGATNILIGQRPTLDDMSNGCFMQRELRLRPVVEKVRRALAATDSPGLDERKLGVVWITGGAGTGKSVLLLQTLARLMTEADVPILYLRHFVSQLPAALEFWRRQDQAAIVAVDDLFSPEFRGSDLWQRIHDVAAPPPPVVILTCGPPDYRQLFELQEKRHSIIEVHHVEMPQLEPSEIKQFASWYARRTGATRIPRVWGTNFVIASFLLERQRRGDADLSEFSARLAERLRQYGVFTEFLAALAANRLGIPAPMRLFEGQRDAFQRFVAEGLCQQSELSGKEEAVLWFHQALARAIYDQLVPSDSLEQQALHLDRFFDSLVDDPESAKSFLDLIGKDGVSGLPEGVAREALRKIGIGLAQREPPNLKILMMVIWQAAASAKVLTKRILSVLTLRRWMESPLVDSQGWGLLFQLLWERLLPEDKKTAAAAALNWLRENADLGSWSYIWRLLWKEQFFESALADLGMEWMASHASTRAWNYVFRDLFDRRAHFESLRGAAIQGLAESPVTVADKYLWRMARELGVPNAQLAAAISRRLCVAVVISLPRQGADLIVELAKPSAWQHVHEVLIDCLEEPGWPYLVEQLARVLRRENERSRLGGSRAATNYKDEAERDLRVVGSAWLTAHEDNPEWNRVWRRLLELAPEDIGLIAAGRAWLMGSEEREQWTYVWQRLSELMPQDQEVRAAGRVWLTGREKHVRWMKVWRRLFELDPGDRDLRTSGRAWLLARGERGAGWIRIWRRMIKLNLADEELLATGRAWLHEHQRHIEWPNVWQVLIALAPQDEKLQDAGRSWLIGHEEHRGWGHVWRSLWRTSPDSSLKHLGEEWLREHRSHPTSEAVGLTLLSHEKPLRNE